MGDCPLFGVYFSLRWPALTPRPSPKMWDLSENAVRTWACSLRYAQ